MSGIRTVTFEALSGVIAQALVAAGTLDENARSVARALALAEAAGHKGHGLQRTLSYAAQVRAGKVDGRAIPQAEEVRTAALAIDARHGFAYPALDLAEARLPALARGAGIAMAGIRRSHHAGALGLVAERLAEAGCVALVFANTPSAMAPWGGRRGLLGTNPIAFAAPRQGGAPVVIDMALSEVARGRIVAAAKSGEAIPEGWATDRDARPTTDAKSALEGSLLPAGGAKGAALALMVEILAAALTGGRMAAEATSFLDAEGSPPGTGQLLIAIDAGVFAGGGGGVARIGEICAAVANEPGARLSGQGRIERRTKALASGFQVDGALMAEVEALGRT